MTRVRILTTTSLITLGCVITIAVVACSKVTPTPTPLRRHPLPSSFDNV